jgi:hypothetical protein
MAVQVDHRALSAPMIARALTLRYQNLQRRLKQPPQINNPVSPGQAQNT